MQKQNIGNAGEYYIASRLSAENFIATITLGRAERYDILAVSPNNRTIKLSVKSRLPSNAQDFPLSEKDDKGGSKDFYYVFVRLNEFKSQPDFWIIPSKRVNEILVSSTKKWLKAPGKNSRKHNYTTMRNLWIKSTKTSEPYFPSNWWDELDTYYKSIEQLK